MAKYTDNETDYNDYPRYGSRLFSIRRQGVDVYVLLERDDKTITMTTTFSNEHNDETEKFHQTFVKENRKTTHLYYLEREQGLIDAVRSGDLLRFLNVHKAFGKYVTKFKGWFNSQPVPTQRGRR